MRSIFRVLIVVVFCFIPGLTGAQGPSTEPITIALTPAYPQPYGTVTISPRSTLIDLNRSTVTITVNGNELDKGSGALNALTTVGGAGERTTIVVTAEVDGQTYRSELVVRPAEASLVVEPVSTTHPFYKGAGLVASEGLVRLVAIPDLRTAPSSPLAAKDLVYTWRVDGGILTSSSGIGKTTLIASAPVRHRNAAVSVMITSQDQSIVAEQTVTITPVDPLVRIYRTDPLLGPLFERALKSPFQLVSEEDGFRAVPYYFARTPIITWAVNGRATETDDEVTVRATGNNGGSAQLEASAREETTSQSARSTLTVRFGSNSILDFFGL
jgi:hypothetical protein